MRYITLTGDVTAITGVAAVGWVRVAALDPAAVPADNLVISAQPIEQELVGGRFTVPVQLPTDSGSAVPVLLELHFLLVGTRPEVWVLDVQTDGDVLDVADARRVHLYPAVGQVPVVSWSQVGEPQGVAPLDDTGRVPAAHLPPGSGGTVAALDDLADVDDASHAETGAVLRKGSDGIWRPDHLSGGGQRGDAVWFRPVPPSSTAGHEPNDVWIDTADFAVYQAEER